MASNPDYWRAIPPFEFGWKQNCQGVRNGPNISRHIFLEFRAGGITCIWFSIEKTFLEVIFDFFLFFSIFFPCFFSCDEKIWKMKNDEKKSCSYKRESHTCCKGVACAMCCRKSKFVCLLVAFWIPESCVVSCCLLSS